jgi:hypothetical protein
MRRFWFVLLLVFVPCIVISATLYAQSATLFTSDFEAGLVGWQTNHLLPGDRIKCRGENCYFRWSKAASTQRVSFKPPLAIPDTPGNG